MPSEPPTDDFSRIERLFNEALSLPLEERTLFLRDRCAADARLFERMQSLLAAHEDEQIASEVHRQSATVDNPFAHHRLGPYELESLLGRGGMGAVYLAHRADGQYEKKVAIKVVDLPLATETFFDRFRQERQILAGLDHPNIARLLDGGVSDEGILFLVMEYVEGIRIDEYCRSRSLSLEAKLRLFITVCGAVQFAHQNLVVHRDLKPDNVLVSKDGVPHLLDFGTAKLISYDNSTQTPGLTREGFLSFTPEYASPEQVLGRPVATTSDTYSLGVLLYKILTEQLPYNLKDFTAEEMIRVICEQPIAPPTFANQTSPDADLGAILYKALRKEPEQRYQTASQFAGDVQAYLNYDPVLARKGNFRYYAIKFARRNRLALSFSAALVLTLIVGVAAVLWQAHTARLAEKSSEASATELSQLSDTLLTELDDAIKQLPGSTGAQQVLVARVLEHLDHVSHDPRSTPFTQLSLANAYVRLANLQANPYDQNLGDIPGALRNLDKALAITGPMGAAKPHDPAILLALARAQDARGEILSFADDNIAAAESLQASSKTYEQLLATPAATPALYFEAGSVIDTLGDVMGQDIGFADAAAALRNYRLAIEYDNRALAIDPNFRPSRRGLASMQMKVGNVELDTDPAAALLDFRSAMTILDALPPSEQAQLNLKRLRALLLRKQAFALGSLGRYIEGLPLFEQSTAIYREISGADPKDIRAIKDLDRLLTNEVFTYDNALNPLLAASGDPTSQNRAIAQKLNAERAAVLENLLRATPNDTATAQALASVTVHSVALQDVPPDVRHLQQERNALTLLRAAASDPRTTSLQLDQALHAFTEAEPITSRDPSFALDCAQRGAAMTHRKAPSWLLSLAQAYRATGNVAQAEATAKEGLALLPDTPANQSFYLRRLLQAETQ